ncbi:MAG: hypothetical protein HC893_14740 [Chloroflexaceae bacterium]|nr:hypothetical protein [Chloroflexaceae bacterium]
MNRFLVVLASISIVMLLGVGQITPTALSQTNANERCFAETGYCITGRIRAYWEQNGGLPVFGYPITPQRTETIEGQPLEVQWFERNRLELHPDNAAPYDVLLGRLGAEQVTQPFPAEDPRPECRYFAQTGFNVCGDILAAWQANGLDLDGQPGFSEAENLALFGLPISPLITAEIEGQSLEVQWFERARFERHPDNAPPFNVLLGLLGNETLQDAPVASEGVPLTIGVQGEDLLFDQNTLGGVQAGQSVNLTFNNISALYRHNWVLLNTNDQAIASQVAQASAEAGRANEFLPADRANIVAATTVLDALESETISFAAPAAPGQYLYICTVPGHYAAGMYGTLIIDP